jgi:RimJ/RimL family protein N-acetyltransferase
VIVALKKEHWPEIEEIMPMVYQDDTTGVVALDDDTGEFLGAVVCEDWTESMCSCHILLKNAFKALRAGIHNALADYVFVQAGRIKVMGLVPANNLRAQRLNRHFGFTELFRIEDGYRVGEDYIVMEMKKENCPYWTEVDNGQESTQAA